MSVKKTVRNALVVAAAATILSSTAAAQSLRINDGASVAISTSPGFTYAVNGTASVLNVTTDGYVMCANIGSTLLTPSSLLAQHERWAMPIANDIRNIVYTGSSLTVNQGVAGFSPETSLGCQIRGPEGEIASPFSGFGDHLFRDSWEDAVQLAHLVNWVPVDRFSWSQPDWTLVPNDSCNWNMDPDAPEVAEDSVCAAVAGVRPVSTASTNDARYGDRAPTMWTATTTSNFIYLARIDARFGPQSGAPNSYFPVVSSHRPDDDQASSVVVGIRDSYDANYLAPNGTYCLLRQLPAVLNDNVCAGPEVFYSESLTARQNNPKGFLEEKVTLDAGFNPAKSMYVAVVRQKLSGGSTPSACQPNSAIATILDPGVARNENGDEFIGDDVVFGFRGTDSFEWMGCNP
ncbi:MAG: hypothetical protein ACTHK2_15965 [Dokdonella sp.]|uniref:hypothetical protein n=1 Tax=Dokdonella sp. TaxID=2291710 RepID=UPI003F8152F2